MTEKQKYVMAIIKIPLEITGSENYRPLSEYINVSFESVDELPEKQEGNFNNESIEKRVLNFLNNSKTILETEANALIVYKDEIKLIKKPPSKNMTFRNKNRSTSKYTLKI